MRREVQPPRRIANHGDHLSMALACSLGIVVLCVMAMIQG